MAKKRKRSKSSPGPVRPWLWILGAVVGAAAVFFFGNRPYGTLPTPGRPVADEPPLRAEEPPLRVAVPAAPERRRLAPSSPERISGSERKQLEGIVEERSR